MLKEQIGKQSIPVKNTIERGAVKKFAEALGDPHPLYIDEAYAASTRYEGLIAPPTFERVLDYGVIEGLPLPKKGIIHGEQKYQFSRPLKVGEVVWCSTKLVDVYEKTGGNGTMTFYVMEKSGVDPQGERIFAAVSVNIITEAVRKEMEG